MKIYKQEIIIETPPHRDPKIVPMLLHFVLVGRSLEEIAKICIGQKRWTEYNLIWKGEIEIMESNQ